MRIVRNVTQIGLDCHRKFSVASVRDQSGRIMERQRLEHRDRGALREVLRSWPATTPVVLEATFGWDWMSDELSAAGLQPRLASSRKVAAWRQSRGMAKSNRRDADLLSRLPSEQENWWEVWLAPREVRDQREWLRHRMALVQIQTGLKNRIHAILHRHGELHEFSDLFGKAGRRFLSLLASDSENALGESGRAALRTYLELLDHVRLLIARATREFRKQVQRSAIARRLMTLPGVSWILAYTILAEIGRIERFRASRQLVAYSLLAPLADDSGEDDGSNPIGRHVGRVGRVTLKWAWIEAARVAVRSKDAQLLAIFNARTDNGARDRARGYVAVARHLSVRGYAVWKRNEDYTENPPPRPGFKPRRARNKTQSSRPGTGQPDPAMVPVP